VEHTPLSALFIALGLMLFFSAFFSMSETAMMAINRYRLAGQVRLGRRGAILAQRLLQQTDKMLGLILLCNNLVNSSAAMLASVITLKLVGQNELALGGATVLVTFAILIFSEATPKVIAASRPEAIAYVSSYVLTFLLKLFYPFVWFVNLFVDVLLRLMRLKRVDDEAQLLSPEELRLIVLESGRFMASKHHTILMNLFELETVTVNDVMTPRHQIETVDLAAPEELRRALYTCHHTRLLVCEGDPDNILGVLHVRKVLALQADEINADHLREILRTPYFIPSGTPLFTQLQYFQENRRRIGLVVDEYGELLGLVTLEDILEQIVGEFTTSAPMAGLKFDLEEDGVILMDGASSLRELNRKLHTDFPLDGPKTLNGLILEYFEAIPEPGTCMVIAGQRMEIVQTQDRSIRSVRFYPTPRAAK